LVEIKEDKPCPNADQPRKEDGFTQNAGRLVPAESPESPNGFFAGYVANKALVGELHDGLDHMTQRDDASPE
jgi:hypothetical protein